MLIKAKVIPRAREEKIAMNGEILKIYVREQPVKGKANKKVIELVAKFFGVSKSDVKIISGEKKREKLIEISS